ncbi:unnamed protein product [Nesidiocoris tenuis]|uniref:Uncharacterized protein n=1 Tax=Nesidiocoris tenuis TaxID=355587 RepID=A0A6H5HGR8_9HEMI|nr:unnamed protein product [Nesidiocoris tenuis]
MRKKPPFFAKDRGACWTNCLALNRQPSRPRCRPVMRHSANWKSDRLDLTRPLTAQAAGQALDCRTDRRPRGVRFWGRFPGRQTRKPGVPNCERRAPCVEEAATELKQVEKSALLVFVDIVKSMLSKLALMVHELMQRDITEGKIAYKFNFSAASAQVAVRVRKLNQHNKDSPRRQRAVRLCLWTSTVPSTCYLHMYRICLDWNDGTVIKFNNNKKNERSRVKTKAERTSDDSGKITIFHLLKTGLLKICISCRTQSLFEPNQCEFRAEFYRKTSAKDSTDQLPEIAVNMNIISKWVCKQCETYSKSAGGPKRWYPTVLENGRHSAPRIFPEDRMSSVVNCK